MLVPLYQAEAEFFRVLGQPVRIRVLELVRSGPMPVREPLAARRTHTAVRTGRTELLELRDGEVPAR